MLRTGKWTVLGLGDSGKMQILLKECKRRHLNVIAVTELHWRDLRTYEIDNWDIIYSTSCSNNKRNSVGAIRASTDLSNDYVSDRLVISLFKCLSTNITFIGHYVPNNRDDNPDDMKTKDAFFGDLNSVTGNVPKQDVIIAIGYLDKIDLTSQRANIDRHTLGDINENGLRHLPIGMINHISSRKTSLHSKNIHRRTSKYEEGDEVKALRHDRSNIANQWKKSLSEVSSVEPMTIRCEQEVTVDATSLEVLGVGDKLQNTGKPASKETDITNDEQRDIRDIYNPQVKKEGSWSDFVECVKTVKRELSKCRKETKGTTSGDWISEHSYELFRKHKQAKEINDGNTCMLLEEELKVSIRIAQKEFQFHGCEAIFRHHILVYEYIDKCEYIEDIRYPRVARIVFSAVVKKPPHDAF